MFEVGDYWMESNLYPNINHNKCVMLFRDKMQLIKRTDIKLMFTTVTQNDTCTIRHLPSVKRVTFL